jgi:hypothetical protein
MDRSESIKMACYKPTGKLLLQFVKFGLVGLTNTAVAYAIYALVIWLAELYRSEYRVVCRKRRVVVLLNNRLCFKKSGENVLWRCSSRPICLMR